MTIYYSASKNAFYSSDVIATGSMPSDKVALTDTEYQNILTQQEQGYRIEADTSTGKPKAVAQGLTAATATVHEGTHATGSVWGHTKLSDSTSSTSAASAGIATTPKAVKVAYDKATTVDNNAVHKTGDETIAGVKTFTEEILTQHSITNAKNQSSADEFHSAMIFRDQQGQAFGHLQAASYADTGDILVKLSAVTGLRLATPDETTHYIGMGMKLDGTPYTTAPTPPANDDSTQIATTEWVQDKVGAIDGNAVHKTGDESIAGTKTFTGAIKAGVDALISHSDDASVVRIDGGSGWDKGASLLLYGKDEASYKGQGKLRVTDGTNTKELILKPDGAATWAGENIVRSVNGSTADASGNVALTISSCTTATKATTTPNVKAATVATKKITAPSGGTWWCFGIYHTYYTDSNDNYFYTAYYVNKSVAGGGTVASASAIATDKTIILCIRIA